MNGKYGDAAVVWVCTVMALLAIAAPIFSIGQPTQFLATLGGILLGPGTLTYRLVTNSSWPQCLMIGLVLNVAALMVLGVIIVAIHFWHPKVELIIPLTTCVLATVFYWRD